MITPIARALALPLLTSALAPSCSATSPAPKALTALQGQAGRTMPALIESYRIDRDDLRNFYNMQASPLRLERLGDFDEAWLKRLDRVDFEGLGVAERIDHHLLRTEIEYQGKQRDLLREQLDGAAELLPFTTAIFELESERWSLEPFEPKACATILEGIAKSAEEVKERVAKQPSPEADAPADEESTTEDAEVAQDAEPGPIEIDPVTAQRVARHVSNARSLLRTWYEHYAEYLPGFAWWNEVPYESAQDSLQALADHLRKEIAGQKGEDDDPLIGDPIGRDALLIDLEHEWLSYSPEELIEIGEREFAWCDAELLKASRAMGHGDDWRAALEAVKSMHVEPGEQDGLVAKQAREAIEFLKERDLVTIPPLCEETWRVQMLSKSAQRTLPFAAYGGQKMLVAFPTSDMDLESKRMSLRGNNIHFTRAVTPHELIPGHHLQGFMAKRHAKHRALFRTPFLVEGWALYWEMVEWDEGWAETPENRVGMLFWRKHRAARIIVSLKFHLGEMGPDEMIDFLVERVGHEVDSATSEVRRYIGGSYSPLYQCGYMIGGLQLRALYREVVDGGLMTRKEFHDAILLENSIPIELIRASLTGTELTRKTKANWRPTLGS